MPVDIIVLAAIAVFVLLRLYGVLGQKIGHDQPPAERDTSFERDSKVIELTPRDIESVKEEQSEKLDEAEEALDNELKDAIADIRALDPSFRIGDFTQGASTAFEMVLEAYAKDDRETLKNLLSKEIYQDFVTELKARKQQDSFTETTLVSILEAKPVRISLKGRQAHIEMQFVSEQIDVEHRKGEDGSMEQGTASDIEQVEDRWEFQRDVRSSNPNWTIIAT